MMINHIMFLSVVFFLIFINIRLILLSWRRKKLSEARLGMVTCVTKMEDLMLKGEIRDGAVCHEIFPIISQAQIHDRYLSLIVIIKAAIRKSHEDRKIVDRLFHELREDKTSFKESLRTFMKFSAWEFLYKQPVLVILFYGAGFCYFGVKFLFSRKWAGVKAINERLESWLLVLNKKADNNTFRHA